MAATRTGQTLARTSGERLAIRARWRGWRRSRPFWAGLFTLLSGALLTLIPLGGLKIAFIQGSVLWASMLIGLLVIVAGGSMWAGGRYHFLAGILTIVFCLVALITSNLGGFFVGTLLGLIGGSLSIAWVPGKAAASPAAEEPTRGAP